MLIQSGGHAAPELDGEAFAAVHAGERDLVDAVAAVGGQIDKAAEAVRCAIGAQPFVRLALEGCGSGRRAPLRSDRLEVLQLRSRRGFVGLNRRLRLRRRVVCV